MKKTIKIITNKFYNLEGEQVRLTANEKKLIFYLCEAIQKFSIRQPKRMKKYITEAQRRINKTFKIEHINKQKESIKICEDNLVFDIVFDDYVKDVFCKSTDEKYTPGGKEIQAAATALYLLSEKCQSVIQKNEKETYPLLCPLVTIKGIYGALTNDASGISEADSIIYSSRYTINIIGREMEQRVKKQEEVGLYATIEVKINDIFLCGIYDKYIKKITKRRANNGSESD